MKRMEPIPGWFLLLGGAIGGAIAIVEMTFRLIVYGTL